MRLLGWAAAAISTVLGAGSAGATTYFEQEFECPIGGEKFTANVVGSSSSWGQRPDGRSYGTLPVYPVTECPGNGFLIFNREFTPEELAALDPLVNSDVYQGLRTSETSYYRIWWLRSQIEDDPYSLAYYLMVAGWQTDGDAERKARYQTAFVETTVALERSEEKADDWFWLNLRAANAYRELERFDESAALLDRLDTAEFIPIGEGPQGGARFLIDELRALNSEQNSASEPANLIPEPIAASRCVLSREEMSAVEITACDGDVVQEAVANVTVRNEAGETLTGADAIRYRAARRPR